MSTAVSPLAWASGYTARGPGPAPNTHTANYSLKQLAARDLVDAQAARELLLDAGLVDLYWQVTWTEDYETFDAELPTRFADVEGYVVFVHGWTGNHLIWEELPAMLATKKRRLLAIAVDHNGFGQARFAEDRPPIEQCNPPAAMHAIQGLVDLLKLRRQPGDPRTRVINFVGHSMGGATLFYLNPIKWRFGEETRYAIAPALLLNDNIHKAFYTTLGLGIGLADRIRAFRPIEQALKPNVIDTLCGGASDEVKQLHFAQYDQTPRATTAATFAAMGLLDNYEIAHRWDLFRMMLGHKDRLVGLVPMMDLLSSLEVPSANIRVVPGSHYMFSVGKESVFHHAQNRELVVQDVLALHAKALAMQKQGQLLG